MIRCRWILLRMTNVSYKYRENQNTHFTFNNFFSEKSNVYEMWKIMVEPERPQMTILRMRFACWITKVTYTCTNTQINTHKHKLRIRNTCWFSTQAMVTRTHLNLTTLTASLVLNGKYLLLKYKQRYWHSVSNYWSQLLNDLFLRQRYYILPSTPKLYF
jgi:hypothetical protein